MGGENYAIQRRREAEDHAKVLEAEMLADRQRTYVTQWQKDSQAKMERAQIVNIAHELRAEDETKLEKRRQRLAELLSREEEQYRQEMEAMQETTADKLARNLDEARAKKKEREEKRQQFAQEQYMRMWRAGCDDLRTLDSEAYGVHIKQEQWRQMHDYRDAARAANAEEERQWAELWEQDRLRKLQRETEEAAKRALTGHRTREAIAQQMEDRAERRRQELAERERAKAEWQAEMQREAAALAAQREAAAQQRAVQGRAIAEWNDNFLKAKAEAKRLKDLEDREEVEQHVADYEAELRRKKMDRLQMQREMVAYREYLMARRAEEARIQRELDQMSMAHQAAANAKQDAAWAREEAGRQRLMREVLDTRAEQLAAKDAAERARQAEMVEERRRAEQAREQVAAEEAAEDAALREAELRHRYDLEMQMKQRANLRAVEQARIKQEHEAALVAEAQYREFVRLEVGRARLSGPKGAVRLAGEAVVAGGSETSGASAGVTGVAGAGTAASRPGSGAQSFGRKSSVWN